MAVFSQLGTRAIVAWSVVGVAALGAAGVGYMVASQSSDTKVLGVHVTNNGNGKGNGNGNGNGVGNGGAGVPGKAFTVSGVAEGALSPGASQLLDVTVTNPNAQDMRLVTLVGSVKSTSKSACDVHWFHIADWAPGPKPTIVPGNGTTVVSMLLTFDDSGTNQDICESTSASPIQLTYSLSATGQQA